MHAVVLLVPRQRHSQHTETKRKHRQQIQKLHHQKDRSERYYEDFRGVEGLKG